MPQPTLTFPITPGYDADIPLQCWDRLNNPAIYQAADVLTVEFRAPGATAPIPSTGITIDWNTKNGTQTGYDQGQVFASIPAAFSVVVQPSIQYRLNVFRQLGSNPNKTERCASIIVVVDSLS